MQTERMRGKGMPIMTDKELKKLNRGELLEILLTQAEQIDKQKKYIHLLEERVSEREIAIEKAGSIAEAAVSLNNVFETAQSAADHYLENIRNLQEKAEKEYGEIQKKAEKEYGEIQKKADEIIDAAKLQASLIEQKAQQKAEQIERDARLKSRRFEQDAQSILGFQFGDESNDRA